MVESRRKIIGLVIVCSLSGVAFIGATTGLGAATLDSTTGSVSVTVSNSGSVGSVTTTTPRVVVQRTRSTRTGLRIVTTPAPSASSSLGSSPVAPVASTDGSEAETGSGSSSSVSGTGSNARPRFANPAVSSAGMGAASAVRIAGAPNQTFSIVLPELTTFASSGQLVTLSNFQHNAGNTPFLGNDGSGVFNVGAQVNQQNVSSNAGPNNDGDVGESVDVSGQLAPASQSPALQSIALVLSDTELLGGDRATVMASAFTLKSPYVNIVVSYN